MEKHSPASREDMRDPTTTEDILHNIDGCMHGPMSGFVDKYFGHFQHSFEDTCLRIHDSTNAFKDYTVSELAPSPERFIAWFTDVVGGSTNHPRCSWRVDHQPDSESAQFFLSDPSNSTTRDEPHPLGPEINVIGQFYQAQDSPYQAGLLALCKLAHMVFRNQPTHLFLHAFYIRGSLAELWIFDRSGLYCSDIIHIQRDFVRFIGILFSYQQMTDQELGKSHLLQTDEIGPHVTLHDTGKIYIDHQPIASRDNLVGSGTSCFRARRPDSEQWTHVLKFKWRWARDRPENELLQLAMDRGARGAISVDHYEEYEDTAYLRRALRWGPQRRFKRSPTPNDNDTPRDLQQERGFTAYTEETEDYFQKRILTCILTSPIGSPLSSFKSLPELLQALLGAIKCHRSLYHDARILHQDISPGNIIIINPKDSTHADGLLIDLDVAVEIPSSSPSIPSTSSITGTRPFMAIGVLQGEPHTYRHDLESFFYVLLWVLISKSLSKDEDNPPATSTLCRWGDSAVEFYEIATYKTQDMQEGLPGIMNEIPPEYSSVRPLIERLHRELFCPSGWDMWIGTDPSPKGRQEMYDGMIDAFEEAIVCCLSNQILP
ncbi:hypothetical protein GGR57DRAFT_376041 [Xylariaceae sp. FL1272]|nr:hypothetical protein GGR57DRAFT_376041 [Xylariaceae sp. FL1272]